MPEICGIFQNTVQATTYIQSTPGPSFSGDHLLAAEDSFVHDGVRSHRTIACHSRSSFVGGACLYASALLARYYYRHRKRLVCLVSRYFTYRCLARRKWYPSTTLALTCPSQHSTLTFELFFGLSFWSFLSVFPFGLSPWSFLLVFPLSLSFRSFLLVFPFGPSSWPFLSVYPFRLSPWPFLFIFPLGLSFWSFPLAFPFGLFF